MHIVFNKLSPFFVFCRQKNVFFINGYFCCFFQMKPRETLLLLVAAAHFIGIAIAQESLFECPRGKFSRQQISLFKAGHVPGKAGHVPGKAGHVPGKAGPKPGKAGPNQTIIRCP
jgi:hypothetical protein